VVVVTPETFKFDSVPTEVILLCEAVRRVPLMYGDVVIPLTLTFAAVTRPDTVRPVRVPTPVIAGCDAVSIDPTKPTDAVASPETSRLFVWRVPSTSRDDSVPTEVILG
jgi:hypothetical protein